MQLTKTVTIRTAQGQQAYTLTSQGDAWTGSIEGVPIRVAAIPIEGALRERLENENLRNRPEFRPGDIDAPEFPLLYALKEMGPAIAQVAYLTSATAKAARVGYEAHDPNVQARFENGDTLVLDQNTGTIARLSIVFRETGVGYKGHTKFAGEVFGKNRPLPDKAHVFHRSLGLIEALRGIEKANSMASYFLRDAATGGFYKKVGEWDSPVRGKILFTLPSKGPVGARKFKRLSDAKLHLLQLWGINDGGEGSGRTHADWRDFPRPYAPEYVGGTIDHDLPDTVEIVKRLPGDDMVDVEETVESIGAYKVTASTQAARRALYGPTAAKALRAQDEKPIVGATRVLGVVAGVFADAQNGVQGADEAVRALEKIAKGIKPVKDAVRKETLLDKEGERDTVCVVVTANGAFLDQLKAQVDALAAQGLPIKTASIAL